MKLGTFIFKFANTSAIVDDQAAKPFGKACVHIFQQMTRHSIDDAVKLDDSGKLVTVIRLEELSHCQPIKFSTYWVGTNSVFHRKSVNDVPNKLVIISPCA